MIHGDFYCLRKVSPPITVQNHLGVAHTVARNTTSLSLHLAFPSLLLSHLSSLLLSATQTQTYRNWRLNSKERGPLAKTTLEDWELKSAQSFLSVPLCYVLKGKAVMYFGVTGMKQHWLRRIIVWTQSVCVSGASKVKDLEKENNLLACRENAKEAFKLLPLSDNTVQQSNIISTVFNKSWENVIIVQHLYVFLALNTDWIGGILAISGFFFSLTLRYQYYPLNHVINQVIALQASGHMPWQGVQRHLPQDYWPGTNAVSTFHPCWPSDLGHFRWSDQRLKGVMASILKTKAITNDLVMCKMDLFFQPITNSNLHLIANTDKITDELMLFVFWKRSLVSLCKPESKEGKDE